MIVTSIGCKNQISINCIKPNNNPHANAKNIPINIDNILNKPFLEYEYIISCIFLTASNSSLCGKALSKEICNGSVSLPGLSSAML